MSNQRDNRWQAFFGEPTVEIPAEMSTEWAEKVAKELARAAGPTALPWYTYMADVLRIHQAMVTVAKEPA